MRHSTTLVDPTAENSAAERHRLKPPAALDGLTVALLDISKPRGDVFLDRIEEKLGAKGLTTKRYRKPTVSKKAPNEIFDSIVDECDIVVEALAD